MTGSSNSSRDCVTCGQSGQTSLIPYRQRTMGFWGGLIYAAVGAVSSVVSTVIGQSKAEQAAKEAAEAQRQADIEAQIAAYEHETALWHEQVDYARQLREIEEAKQQQQAVTMANITRWIAIALAGALAIAGIRIITKNR